jgi:hypothetical protein
MVQQLVRWLKRPLQIGVFIAHFCHHTLAFFVWASLLLHVVLPMISAGSSARFVSSESQRFSMGDRFTWRSMIAVALVPATLIALRQAYLSWEDLRGWLQGRGYGPSPVLPMLKWPVRTCRFLATLLQQTAGFYGWVWIVLALVGSIGQIGFHAATVWENGVAYFTAVGGPDWQRLLALSSLPALLIAVWNAKRAWRRLQSRAQPQMRIAA